MDPTVLLTALEGLIHEGRDDRSKRLIRLAEKLVAGGDQIDMISSQHRQASFHQVLSIFDRINLGSGKSDRTVGVSRYFPMKPLFLQREALFPGKALGLEEQEKIFSDLINKIDKNISRSVLNSETDLENALSYLQRHGWCISTSNTQSLSDMSYYDYSRMTAALTVCLRDFPDGTIEQVISALDRHVSRKPESEDEPLLAQTAALMVGGDISGIQDFIYTLSAKDAAKTLRGRSLYLQLLTEAVMRFVLRDLGIPTTNVIYSGGGHFYLLAPVSASEKMEQLRSQVTQKLLRHHSTDLYFALDFAELPFNGFLQGALPKYWNEMHRNISARKQHRYAELGSDLYSKVFEPVPHGGNNEKVCVVCGRESDRVYQLDGGEADEKICPQCQSFIDMGGKLTQSPVILLTMGEPVESETGDAYDALADFGLGVSFAANGTSEVKPSEKIVKKERGVLWLLDDTEAARKCSCSDTIPAARLDRYMVHHIPAYTFDELANKATGIARLGVLRMDADNMSDLFRKGFGEGEKSIATLARYSALSFQLSLFFEGWVKKLCEESGDHIYAVYSGGDDLFLLAPWHLVPDLARKIAGDFTEYTGNNPSVHISGGMTFIHGKYPLYQAAEDAHDALEQAKSLEGKAAFDFLGQPWKWQEFDQLKGKFDRLLRLVSKDSDEGLDGPQAILQSLQMLSGLQKEKAKKSKAEPVFGSWMWLGAYQLTRMAEKEEKKNPELAKEIKKILAELNATSYGDIREWGVAARWVQLYVRNKTEKATVG